MKPMVEQLSNGLSVVAYEMPQSPLVATSLMVRGGARVERDSEVGVAHFMEHMLFHGNEKFASEQIISDLVEGHGGEFNACTTREFICCYIRGFREHAEMSCDILANIAFRSAFSPHKITTECGAILQEIAEKKDDPGNYGSQLYTNLIWGNHPMGRDIGGQPETIVQYQRKHLKSYYDRFFAANNMVLSFAGGISHADALRLAQKYFGQYSSCEVHIPKNEVLAPTAERVVFSERNTQQAICFLGRTPASWISYGPEHTKDRISLLLLMHILGEGVGSRLFRAVRTEKGLVYTIKAVPTVVEDFGYFSIYFGADASNIARALEIILKELDMVVACGVTEEELMKAKNGIRRSFAEVLENSLGMANTLGQRKIMGLDDLDLEENFREHILPITCDDVLSLARRIFDEQHLRFAAIGSIKQYEKDIEKVLIEQ